MAKIPAWWRPDAPHWNGRTTALIALATFIAGTMLGAVGLTRPSDPPSAQVRTSAAQPLPAGSTETPNDLCSDDSEGKVADGWGPDRPTYHDDTFPAALTFNSTSSNSVHGDERDFLDVKPNSIKQAGGWQNTIEVEDGSEYLVRIYVRLDGPVQHSAKDTKLNVLLPTCTGHRVGISATLSSMDVFPREIWDGASFWSRRDFNLVVAPDSGKIYSNAHPNPGMNFSVNDLVARKGISLGSKGLDGIFMSGYEHDVFVTFVVRAQVAK